MKILDAGVTQNPIFQKIFELFLVDSDELDEKNTPIEVIPLDEWVNLKLGVFEAQKMLGVSEIVLTFVGP